MSALTTLFPVFFMIALGLVSRIKGWITPEQKAGANAIIFNVLFPVMIFNLMLTASIETSTIYIVAYVLVAFLLAMFVGKIAMPFVSQKYNHFAYFLLTSVEGGNVALPLYLSIVGASSNTVIFDIAGTFIAFVFIPIMIARSASQGASKKDLVKNIFTNSFVLAVIFGLGLNILGGYTFLQSTPIFDLYTGTISQVTTPIVGMILFILGYDLNVDKETLVPILKLVAVRVAFYAVVIVGFFIIFPTLMADKIFMLAVLLYFMCPTGFGLVPVISPLFKSDEDASFASAYISLFMIVTLIVYTVLVIFVA